MVRELLETRPDEVWVIQINPQQLDTEPTTLAEIADRRNELAGNLSLYQELAFIEKIDQLLETGQLNPGHTYKQIVVRVIELSRHRLPGGMGPESKLNRDPRFIQNLMSHGEQQAAEFLAARAFERAWMSADADAVMRLFADDCELVSVASSAQPGHYRGQEQVRGFVQEQISHGLRMDLTHKHLARERVTWTIRAPGGSGTADRPGYAEAEFRSGKVATLRIDVAGRAPGRP